MKRIWMILITIAVLGLCAPLQPSAGEGNGDQQLSLQERDKIRQENFSTFLKETAELRKELAEKQNESRELLLAENPDRNKIAMISEQIYQLIDTIQEKVRIAGVEQGLGAGTTGCGCRRGGPGPAKTL